MKSLAAAVACFIILSPLSTKTGIHQLQAVPAQQKGQGEVRFVPVSPVEQSKIDPVKEADIRRLLEVSGGAATANQAMAEMEKTMRPTITNSLPPGEYREKLLDLFFERFHSKFDMHQITEMAVPIYDKYLSDEEIRELIGFYSTPIGKKTLTVMPKMISELSVEGFKRGQEAGRESMIEILSEHPELQKALEEAAKSKQPQ